MRRWFLRASPAYVGAESEATVAIIDRGQVTCTWTGTLNSDWFTPGNWDVGEVPYIGGKAVINGAPDVSLVGETHPLLSLQMGGGKLVFNGWDSKLICREITINAVKSPMHKIQRLSRLGIRTRVYILNAPTLP